MNFLSPRFGLEKLDKIYRSNHLMLNSNQNPEQIARDQIDQIQLESYRIIHSYIQKNIEAGLGIAFREYLSDSGSVDYILFVYKKLASVIEAKQEEERCLHK